MKALKLIIGSLLVAIAIAGCASATGSANLDYHDKVMQDIDYGG